MGHLDRRHLSTQASPVLNINNGEFEGCDTPQEQSLIKTNLER